MRPSFLLWHLVLAQTFLEDGVAHHEEGLVLPVKRLHSVHAAGVLEHTAVFGCAKHLFFPARSRAHGVDAVVKIDELVGDAALKVAEEGAAAEELELERRPYVLVVVVVEAAEVGVSAVLDLACLGV